VAAVGELENEYGDEVDFVVISAAETAQRAHEIEEFGFTDLRHGLVGFTADGVPLVKMPGHQYGKPEIVAAIEALLATQP
jgi:hypothetical protein